MRRVWPAGVLALALGVAPLAAQDAAVGPTVIERRFESGLPDSVLIKLRDGVVYWAEVVGPGAPLFRAVHRYHGVALVVPHEDRNSRRFEVHPGATDTYIVTIEGRAPEMPSTLRLVLDEPATRRRAEERERDLAVGLLLGAGAHTGYRLDPTGGLDPRGGGDFEACVMVQPGGPVDACLGVGREDFPDADFSVTWIFVEPRLRILSRPLLGGSLTDLTAAFRLSQAPEAGPRALTPILLSLGLYVTQHLTGDGRRRGWSLYTAWHHGRLGNVPETEMRNVDRITAGLLWVP
jgi:hypothetical protein